MGSVYVGYDEKLGRRVAIKAVRHERRTDSVVRNRFQREARALSQLDHPNICRIYGYVEEEEADFLVLELIEGKELRQIIRERKATREQRLKVAEQIATALAAAHERGIVHRDVKPANVMVTPSWDVKVLDFGLARTVVDENALTLAGPSARTLRANPIAAEENSLHTRLGTVLGTLAYMSPEQARGEPVTTASDMYSFGLVLQELVTGEPPVDTASTQEDLLLVAREGRSRPVIGIDSGTATLIRRLKSLAPSVRPSALDTVERIRWIVTARSRRFRRIASIAAIVTLAGLSAGLAFTAWRATTEAERANREAKYNSESWLRHVENLAQVEATLLKYAVLTSDQPLAVQLLDSLAADERIRWGCVFDTAGRVLGQNRTGGSSLCPSISDRGPEGYRIALDELQVWRPVLVGDQRNGRLKQVGTVLLAADADYAARLRGGGAHPSSPRP